MTKGKMAGIPEIEPMVTERTESKEVSRKSPFAGCAILIAALAVMVFLVVFSVYALFRQFGEIAKFTGEEPQPVEIARLEDKERDLNRLAQKLEVFRLAVGDGKTTILELDAAEMNLAIAAYESFKGMRGTLRILDISRENIRFQISFQLNGKPRISKKGEEGLMSSDPRFLNGTMVATPGLLQKEVVLQISDIEVPDATVPPEFVQQMSPYRIAERYVGSEGIGATMAGLTSVSLGDGVVRFEKKEGVVTADTITDSQVDDASKKLFTVFGIAASGVLLFVGIVLFLSLRLKKSRENAV